MIPPRFEYHAPQSVGEAVALLGQYGSDAKLLAGGHSLLPMMKLRIARPELLIDINDLDGDYTVLPIAEWANVGDGPKRVVQPEYNRAGDEVWFSVWSGKEEESAIVVVEVLSIRSSAIEPAQRSGQPRTMPDISSGLRKYWRG